MSNQTYLNTAACGLLPKEFTQQAIELYHNMADNASGHAEHWRDKVQPELKSAIAKFLNTDVANIALLPNFSWGINGVVQSLKGDEKVLLYSNDYPSLTEPFKNNGFNITWVGDNNGFAIDMPAIKEHIISKAIDIVAISHVQWMSGYKVHIKELGALCKENGVSFIVDATQSLGAIEIDLTETHTDVLISSNYKWMNAGFGSGIMYIHPDFIKKYTPAVVGFNSFVMSDGVPTYTPGLRSYEPGHPNMFGFAVLHAAVLDKLDRGVSQIEAYNKKLSQYLLTELDKVGQSYLGEGRMENRASIILLKDDGQLWQKLQAHQIVASQRGGNIRLGIHYYNTEADIDQLISCIKI